MRRGSIVEVLTTIQHALGTVESITSVDPALGPEEKASLIGARLDQLLIEIRGVIHDYEATGGPIPGESQSTTKEGFMGEPGF